MPEQIVVAYDPDFDASSKDIFDCIGPRNAFIAGLVLSILTVMSVGFLVLLNIVL